MKSSSTKKLFAFIITAMLFSTIPQLAGAQKNKPCPQGYKEECYYYIDPWSARGTRICLCVPNGNGKNATYNSISDQSIATNFELEHPLIVSIKIYDATGRLIKTLANNAMQIDPHQIKWNAKDENENPVGSGVYLLKMQAGNYVETKKISVLK